MRGGGGGGEGGWLSYDSKVGSDCANFNIGTEHSNFGNRYIYGHME